MHPRLFLNFCQEQKIDTHGVTEASIRTFVKEQKIGCISSRIRFRGTLVQVSAVHVPEHGLTQMSLGILMNVSVKN